MANDTLNNPAQNNSESDWTRKVLAALVGLFVIIVLVLSAKWVGDKVREKFFTPKGPTVNSQIIPVEDNTAQETGNQSTASAIPKTGPADVGYFVMGLLFLGGVVSLTLAKTKTS